MTGPIFQGNPSGTKSTITIACLLMWICMHHISQLPELEKYFQVIIVAGEKGIPPKPNPQPFRLCLQKLDIDPSEAVYVGDDYRIDICGAHDAGLHPVWLQHRSVRRNWPEVKTDAPIITRLDELLDLNKLFL